MRVIRAASYRRMPWKNGGGETIEVAVSPDGAGLDAFDWRVSMARVAAPGPFSLFPGIDRTLAILDGAGLLLSGPKGTVELTASSNPYSFPADTPVEANLPDGAVMDLNVMSRRGAMRHRLTRRVLEGSVRLSREADAMLVLPRGEVQGSRGDATTDLSCGDGLFIADGVLLSARRPVTLFVAEFWRVSSPLPLREQ